MPTAASGCLSNPNAERISFVCTSPGVDGLPWLQLPLTFDLKDPVGYFQTEIYDRRIEAVERNAWKAAIHAPVAHN